MYAYEDIRHVHLEPTTRCNAHCPMCARNAYGVTAPGLELTELLAEDVRQILPGDMLARITGFDLCGAYGEPALARDFIDIITYVRSVSPECVITAHTNGGVQSPKWWKRLAESLRAPGRMVFSIDGLGETNRIHRRGVNFEKVIENARAFIGAGGEARWEFLAFRHNEHQIEAARALSEELGFREFSVKKTARFLEPTYDFVPGFHGHGDLSHFPIYAASGRVVGYLEPPRARSLVNDTLLRYIEIVDRYGSLEALFSTTPIQCRVADSRSVFVGAQGYVFPCCWAYVQATRPGLCGFPPGADRQVYDLVEATGGFQRISARDVGIRAAVEGALFAAIESSWSCASVSEGRLRVCARACGTEFPAYFGQFENPSLLPRSLQATHPHAV